MWAGHPGSEAERQSQEAERVRQEEEKRRQEAEEAEEAERQAQETEPVLSNFSLCRVAQYFFNTEAYQWFSQ